jgi:hypothetical protein
MSLKWKMFYFLIQWPIDWPYFLSFILSIIIFLYFTAFDTGINLLPYFLSRHVTSLCVRNVPFNLADVKTAHDRLGDLSNCRRRHDEFMYSAKVYILYNTTHNNLINLRGIPIPPTRRLVPPAGRRTGRLPPSSSAQSPRPHRSSTAKDRRLHWR